MRSKRFVSSAHQWHQHSVKVSSSALSSHGTLCWLSMIKLAQCGFCWMQIQRPLHIASNCARQFGCISTIIELRLCRAVPLHCTWPWHVGAHGAVNRRNVLSTREKLLEILCWCNNTAKFHWCNDTASAQYASSWWIRSLYLHIECNCKSCENFPTGRSTKGSFAIHCVSARFHC